MVADATPGRGLVKAFPDVDILDQQPRHLRTHALRRYPTRSGCASSSQRHDGVRLSRCPACASATGAASSSSPAVGSTRSGRDEFYVTKTAQISGGDWPRSAAATGIMINTILPFSSEGVVTFLDGSPRPRASTPPSSASSSARPPRLAHRPSPRRPRSRAWSRTSPSPWPRPPARPTRRGRHHPSIA